MSGQRGRKCACLGWPWPPWPKIHYYLAIKFSFTQAKLTAQRVCFVVTWGATITTLGWHSKMTVSPRALPSQTVCSQTKQFFARLKRERFGDCKVPVIFKACWENPIRAILLGHPLHPSRRPTRDSHRQGHHQSRAWTKMMQLAKQILRRAREK